MGDGMTPTPGQRAYLAYSERLREKWPGADAWDWRELSDLARAEWEAWAADSDAMKMAGH